MDVGTLIYLSSLRVWMRAEKRFERGRFYAIHLLHIACIVLCKFGYIIFFSFFFGLWQYNFLVENETAEDILNEATS